LWVLAATFDSFAIIFEVSFTIFAQFFEIVVSTIGIPLGMLAANAKI
jgi:hypothetical protein